MMILYSKSAAFHRWLLLVCAALNTAEASIPPGRSAAQMSVTAPILSAISQPEHLLPNHVKPAHPSPHAMLTPHFHSRNSKPSAITEQSAQVVTMDLPQKVHAHLRGSTSVDHPISYSTLALLAFALVLAAVVYSLVWLRQSDKHICQTSKLLENAKAPAPGPSVWSDSSQSWHAVYALGRSWLKDEDYKWRARGLVLLVFVHWLGREALWAFVLSKANAEVINAISELHSSHDMSRVKWALFVWMGQHMLLHVPIIYMVDLWVEQWFCISLRSFITHKILRSYLNGGGHAFYRIKMKESENKIDNPDQRIGQDIAEIVGQIYNIYASILSAIFGSSMWAAVFFMLGGPKLLVIALLAAGIRVLVAYGCFGKSLVNSYQAMLWTAADLRYTLTRVRENAESVALSGGGAREQERTYSYFERHVDAIKTSTWVNMLYGSAMHFILHWPSLLIWLYQIPAIAKGLLEMGDAIRVHQGYDQVSKVLDFFTAQMVPITVLQANSERLHQLWVACEGENVMAGRQGPLCKYQSTDTRTLLDEPLCQRTGNEISFEAADPPVAFALENVVVTAPGSVLNVGGASVCCEIGAGLLVSGASGLGKSSVLKALAGLWLNGEGIVRRAEDAEVILLPQTCYIPQGTLFEVAIYPRKVPELSQMFEEMSCLAEKSLRRAHLGQVVQRWTMGGDSRDWAVILSPGERQRLGFARLFFNLELRRMASLNKDVKGNSDRVIAVLDESTSAVDTDMEAMLYQEVRAEMKKGILISIASVGHRPTLPTFHEMELQIGEQPTGRPAPGELLADGTWQTPDGETVPWRHFASSP
mmetsp:Transcript_108475/g.188321  ORF Transcript_108475/g.188321 Transcript_108475/m.188321 type:complete len:816 (+) Transcript_108475:83-2530(+)